ncbi:MAG: hypothetical protein ACM3S2_14845 [Ignavibacteriales bacterium]
MQNNSNQSMYNEWTIEKGDYVRKDLSKQDKYYKQKMSLFTKVLITSLSVLVIILAIILKTKI